MGNKIPVVATSICFLFVSIYGEVVLKRTDFNDAHLVYMPLNIDETTNSIWGAIGINPDDLIMVAVSNHVDNVAICTYDPAADELRFKGYLREMIGLDVKSWQAKVHTYVWWSKVNDKFLFGTDAGDMRSESIAENMLGYGGGYWCSYDPSRNTIDTLCAKIAHRGIKSAVYSEISHTIFGITDPTQHLISYDVLTGKTTDYGRINGFYQPRVLFCDKWGNPFTNDEFGELIKFDIKTRTIIDLKTGLPRCDKIEFWKAASGIVAAQQMADGSVVGHTFWGIAFQYIPEMDGPGTMRDLGPVWGEDSVNGKWNEYYAPNLAVVNNRMYYCVGGHGQYVDKQVILVEKMIESGTKRKICALKRVLECTGSAIVDSKSNVYFCGHGVQTSRFEMFKKMVRGIFGIPRKQDQSTCLIKFNPNTLER